VGNVGDSSVSSYRLYASEIQQLVDATAICYLRGVDRLATRPSNAAVKI